MSTITILLPLVLLAMNASVGMSAETAAGDGARMLPEVKDFQRRTLYHSRQTPGYTCWTAICRGRDGAPILTFCEATGPMNGRERAPAEIARRMPGDFQNPSRDFTGLTLENVVLTSGDGGQTWREEARERFRSCLNFNVAGGLMTLHDGSLLRSVWGQVMGYDRMPPTGFVQRSHDGGATWGRPEPLCRDERMQAWPRRLRQLRDGRVLATGSANAYDPATWTWDDSAGRHQPCYWVSDGPACTRWSGPYFFAAQGSPRGYEEWDAVELADGALLGVIRLPDGIGQFVCEKRTDGWSEAMITRGPFPQSGHPELLATREGPVLYIAANGIWATLDRGAGWRKVQDVPAGSWYPTALQRGDGLVLCASHIGGDDEYGARDESIVLDTFRVGLRRLQ
jgi:hypothetical protein